ncbi:hypothetical protein F4823DRAFT_602573 [Ustulina deusta]|nr:hypothetical protein F4823DRAFT_602573 [Ustulina deusta]
MMGPTTLSDHLSVIHTYESQFNSSLRVIWPIPHTIGVPRSILGLTLVLLKACKRLKGGTSMVFRKDQISLSGQ